MIMKTFMALRAFLASALVLTLTGAAANAAEVEDRIEREFNVQPGGQLVLDADRGSIDVQGSTGTVVTVVVERKASASRSAKAADVLRRHAVTFQEGENQLEVRGRLSGRLTSGWLSRQRLEVRYRVLVPEQFNVNLRTAGGSIQVATLKGTVESRTSGGALTFRGIRGPVKGQTSGGGIDAEQIQGAVDVRTGGGGIRLREITGDTVAHTSGGSVRVAGLRGRLEARTSGGGISVGNAEGPVDARTSGGSVEATFAAAPMADCRLETSGGSITVNLPTQSAFALDASTSGGRVRSEFPVQTVVQGEAKPNAIRGTVNGGGPKITARTSGGSVSVKSAS
jgi:DUF4097 and DUF4098 domain-containing protein YvlB